jgi:O-antigen/teichoic acid export membrane protein
VTTNKPDLVNNAGSIGHRAIWGTIYTFFGDYTVYIINFVRGIILARLVGPEIFGVIAMADFYKTLLSQPVNIGFEQSLIYQKEKLDEGYNGYYLMVNGFSIFSLIVGVIISPILLRYYSQDIVFALIALLAILVIQTLGSAPTTHLRKTMRFGKLSIAQIVAAVIAFIVSIYLAWLGFSLVALLAVQLVTVATNTVFAWVYSGWRFTNKFDRKINMHILRFGGIIWIRNFFGFISTQFDNFLVGQVAGITMLGFYSKAYNLAQQPLGLFAQVTNKVAEPLIAEIKDDKVRLEKTFNLMISLVFKATLYVGMVLFVWAPEIINLLIGERWLPMVPMFRGLVIFLVARPVWELVSTFYTFIGKPEIVAKGQGIQAILLLIFGTIAVYTFGAFGVAVVVSTIFIGVTLGYLINISRLISLAWNHIMIMPILTTLTTGIASYMLISALRLPSLLFWLSVGVVPILVYVGLTLILQGKFIKQDLSLLIKIARKK